MTRTEIRDHFKRRRDVDLALVMLASADLVESCRESGRQRASGRGW